MDAFFENEKKDAREAAVDERKELGTQDTFERLEALLAADEEFIKAAVHDAGYDQPTVAEAGDIFRETLALVEGREVRETSFARPWRWSRGGRYARPWRWSRGGRYDEVVEAVGRGISEGAVGSCYKSSRRRGGGRIGGSYYRRRDWRGRQGLLGERDQSRPRIVRRCSRDPAAHIL